MRYAAVAEVGAQVAATTKRGDKTSLLAALLAQAEPGEIEPLIGFLVGDPRQGALGSGWAAIGSIDAAPAPSATLTVLDVDAALSRLQATTGPGSQAERAEQLSALFGRATREEQDHLGRLIIGDLRQGALAGLVTDAVAKAAGTPGPLTRRAAMLSGDLGVTARAALTGGQPALEAIGLHIGRGVQPMLASTAESVADAVDALGEVSVEWKLDGIRIQVHKSGPGVRVFTRNLNEVTARVPDVVRIVQTLDAETLVLDGEVIAATTHDTSGRATAEPDESPVPFQDVMSQFGSDAHEDGPALAPWFFDLLHLDGRDLIDEPLSIRRGHLAELVGEHVVPGHITTSPDEAAITLDQALAAGHEGVMVKAAHSPYLAGRRGKTWRKVKPVHTFDLVVLAIEWGHGRRTGYLSNLHLGALGPDGEPLMVGKTFKGMTDEMLRWQTERFTELAISPETIDDHHVVPVRPEQVVEIAIDGVQRSTRYPGGVALRFARVKQYRADKPATEADRIESLQELL